MCTSIRSSFNRLECQGKQNKCAEARNNKSLHSVDLSSFTKAIVFRDPFERMYSAYSNSNVNKLINVEGCQNSSECTFEKWVNKMYLAPETYFENEHFKPQHEIAQMNFVKYDYELRMSSKRDMLILWDLLKSRSVHSNKSHKSNSSAPLAAFKQLPVRTLNKIAKIYKGDLDLWARILENRTHQEEGEFTIFDYYRNVSGI